MVGFVLVTERKARATDFIITARAAGQATHKGGFTSTEITDKLDDFTTTKLFTQ
jgi:hypothetical protein